MSSAKPTRSGLLGIIDHVKTKDAHAFPGGVASMWRRNVISGTRDWEADAVEVAERTAWASCLLKGILREVRLTLAQFHRSEIQLLSDGFTLARPFEWDCGPSHAVELYLPE